MLELDNFSPFYHSGALEWILDPDQRDSDVEWFDGLTQEEAQQAVRDVTRVDRRSTLDLARLAVWTADTPEGLVKQDLVFDEINRLHFNDGPCFGEHSIQGLVDILSRVETIVNARIENVEKV